MWNEIKNIKSDRKALKDFGLTIGVILTILGLIAIWRSKAIYPYFLGAGLLFIISGLLMPKILNIPNKIWMTFSIVVGFFMSRIILSVLFYGVMSPIGFAMRISGKDILDERFEKGVKSYWRKIDSSSKTKESYEKQY